MCNRELKQPRNPIRSWELQREGERSELIEHLAPGLVFSTDVSKAAETGSKCVSLHRPLGLWQWRCFLALGVQARVSFAVKNISEIHRFNLIWYEPRPKPHQHLPVLPSCLTFPSLPSHSHSNSNFHSDYGQMEISVWVSQDLPVHASLLLS